MDKKLMALISVFVIAFILFVSILAFNEPLKRFTSAKEDIAIDKDSSLLFAWPLSARAGTPVKVDIFVRSSTGKPLSEKNVIVATTLGTLSATAVKTDKAGKASLEINSDVPGIAEVSAVVDGVPLEKKLTVRFEP